MATIEQRVTEDGTKSYRVKVRIKGHPARSATFSRKTDAKRWAAQTEAAIRERRHFEGIEAQKHTLAEAIDRYVRTVLPDKGQGTQDSQLTHLDWWKTQIGDITLADVTPQVLSAAREKAAAAGSLSGLTPTLPIPRSGFGAQHGDAGAGNYGAHLESGRPEGRPHPARGYQEQRAADRPPRGPCPRAPDRT